MCGDCILFRVELPGSKNTTRVRTMTLVLTMINNALVTIILYKLHRTLKPMIYIYYKKYCVLNLANQALIQRLRTPP